jgi:hypothetical protein
MSLCRKRRVGFDQALLLEIGPEFGRNLRLKRIVVFLDLLSAPGAHNQGDSDIGCGRELQRGGAQIDTMAAGGILKFSLP